MRGTLKDRFHAKYVKRENACWEWIGFIHPGHKRGIITLNRKHLLAHRVSWEIHHGPIDNGLFVCHHCDTPKCVNPKHLFLGTDMDNMTDRNKKNRQAHGKVHGNYVHGKYVNQARWRTRPDGSKYFYSGNKTNNIVKERG